MRTQAGVMNLGKLGRQDVVAAQEQVRLAEAVDDVRIAKEVVAAALGR